MLFRWVIAYEELSSFFVGGHDVLIGLDQWVIH